MRLNRAKQPGATQRLATNGPGEKKKKHNLCSFLLQDENANKSQFSRTPPPPPRKEHLSITEEENGERLSLFELFPHDILGAVVPGSLRLLFCYTSNSNNPVCVDATLLFHPQQMCLRARVSHGGGLLTVLLGSRETAGRHTAAASTSARGCSRRTALTFTLQKHSARILSAVRTREAQARLSVIFNVAS